MTEIAASVAFGTRRKTDLSRFLQSPANMLFLRHSPVSWSRSYIRLLGKLFYAFAPQQAAAVQEALDACLPGKLTEADAKSRWAKVRSGIMEHYFEKLFLGSRPLSEIRRTMLERVSISGRDLLDEYLAQGQGLLLVTGHFGAVEFMPGALGFRGYPVTIMVHCKTPALQKIIEEKAAQSGVELLDPKSGSVFFAAMKALKEGRILITQCDEMDTWRPYKDKRINFLGLDMGLDKSMDVLAKKAGAPVLFGLNHRHGNGTYELVLEKPEAHPAARGHEILSAQCLSVLNSYIYMHPEAWYEWKKIKPLLKNTRREVVDESKKRLGLPGEMAVYSPSTS